MRNEEILQQAISQVIPADHLAMNGQRDAGAVYRSAGERQIYESDTLLMTQEIFQVHVYQLEYDPAIVAAVRGAVIEAGFTVTIGNQVMEGEYYRDELRATKRKED